VVLNWAVILVFSSYIHHVLGFIGIEDVTFIDSSGIGRDEKKVLTSAKPQLVGLELLLRLYYSFTSIEDLDG